VKFTFTQRDKDMFILDLGQEVDFSGFKGFEVTGIAPGQIQMEFYDDDLDMNMSKEDGAEFDWYDSEMQVGSAGPFFQGSCSWRYEEGGFNYTLAKANGKTAEADGEEYYLPTEETCYDTLDHMNSGKGKSWEKARYLKISVNKSPQLVPPPDEDDFETVDQVGGYVIKSMKFLLEDTVACSEAGFYNVVNTSAEEPSDLPVEDMTAGGEQGKAYTTGVIPRNFSSMKYLRVSVEDATYVSAGLLSEGAEDVVVIGNETGTGNRSIYIPLDDYKDSKELDLSKITKIWVATDGKVTKLGVTRGLINFKDGETKFELFFNGDKNEVTKEEYGVENSKPR
jgi:hypothetical protein